MACNGRGVDFLCKKMQIFQSLIDQKQYALKLLLLPYVITKNTIKLYQ